MHRRELLARLPLFLMAVPMVGCILEDDDHYPQRPGGVTGTGGGDYGEGGGGGSELFTVANNDDSGHSHTFELSCTSLESGVAIYTAIGPHTHQVQLSDRDIDDVLAGDTVELVTTGGHRHVWFAKMPNRLCD